MAYILGIDTGGTYTDSVILDAATKELICWAKAYTTYDDLCIGLRNSLKALHFQKFSQIRQVSLSTTLATNAVVENKRCSTGLLVLGKMPPGEFPTKEAALLKGRMNIRGHEEQPLDLEEARSVISDMAGRVEAFAVSGYASVRNPVHELQIRELVQTLTGAPVFCAHELCSDLGYYQRTVTTVLNASLTKVIHRFCRSAMQVMEEFRIQAPVMIVKGDGSLMRAETAVFRPVETIMSGPASSIAGARHLTGLEDALILDMGGTTVDIANLENGSVQTNEHGARINGWYTQVHAVQISTYGIGGDSAVCWDGSQRRLKIGPDKIYPLGRREPPSAGVKRGFTPTDCKFLNHTYSNWDAAASREGLRRLSAESGIPEAAIHQAVRSAVTREIIVTCLQAVADFEGRDIDIRSDQTAAYLLSKAWDAHPPFFKLRLRLQKPIIAVGGAAGQWIPDAAAQLGCRVVVPEHAQVANAIGAALMEIRESCQATVRKEKGGSADFVCFLPGGRSTFSSYEEAVRYAREETERIAREKAVVSGCVHPQVHTCLHDILTGRTDGAKRELVETQIKTDAYGPAF